MPVPTISELKKKDDAALLELLGYNEKLAEFKSAIEEADKLSGKPREKVEERIREMFTPHVYPDSIKYAVESAKRSAKRSGKEELACCNCDILD